MKTTAWLMLAICGVIVLLWSPLIRDPGAILFSTDANIGQNALMKSQLPAAFTGGWQDAALLGAAEFVPLNLRFGLTWLLPARFFTNWSGALFLGLAALFLILYLRSCRLHAGACLIGVLTAFFLSSNLTLVYPGHLSKLSLLIFAVAYLYCVTQAVRAQSIGWSILTGGAIGAMFMEQADVALFFAGVLGPYALVMLWRQYRWRWSVWARVLGPLALMAGALAVHPLWGGYTTAVRGVESMQAEDPVQKWNYCTQWSWPPEESIDFIAPGFMGWRSGEPQGPYWGRMGRSPGWGQTRQGFQNFKLENMYLGAIPVLLALWAVVLAFYCRRQRRRSADALEITPDGRDWMVAVFFWSAVAGLTLLLSFGKYFPLYKLFYSLPLVSSIRNPNKFLQVFQLALAILAAYGCDRLLRNAAARKSEILNPKFEPN